MDTLNGLWGAILELDFITSFFTWFFKLLSRLAEPLLTLAAIYVIISAGVPAAKMVLLYDLAVAVMIGAPEIILPGAFVLASEQRERGNKQAWLLSLTCWGFVLLTGLTLASLFMWHFDQGGLNVLMWGRCVVGVGYSILLRVLMHQEGASEPESELVNEPAMVDELVNQMNLQMQGVQGQVSELASALRVHMLTMDARLNELATPLIAEVQVVESEPVVSVIPAIEPSEPCEQREPLHLVPSLGEPLDEPLEVRVKRFIRVELDCGNKPTLNQIMNQCGCSKNTAIRYRRELAAEQTA